MNLTDKCLDDFNMYWSNVVCSVEFTKSGYYSDVDYMTPSMQWGVIQDYGDSVGYLLTASPTIFTTRQEARIVAIKKFDELRNIELNK